MALATERRDLRGPLRPWVKETSGDLPEPHPVTIVVANYSQALEAFMARHRCLARLLGINV